MMQLYALAPDKRSATLVDEVLRYFPADTLGDRRALVELAHPAPQVAVVPLDRLRAVQPQPDRVLLPADALGDLVRAAELAAELLAELSRTSRPSGAARNLCTQVAARVEHATAAALDHGRTLEAWEVVR